MMWKLEVDLPDTDFWLFDITPPHISFRLECLEKHEAPLLQDGYCVSRAALSIADTTQSVFAAVDQYAIQKQNAQEGRFSPFSLLHERV